MRFKTLLRFPLRWPSRAEMQAYASAQREESANAAQAAAAAAARRAPRRVLLHSSWGRAHAECCHKISELRSSVKITQTIRVSEDSLSDPGGFESWA
jgi:hypothetical protein